MKNELVDRVLSGKGYTLSVTIPDYGEFILHRPTIAEQMKISVVRENIVKQVCDEAKINVDEAPIDVRVLAQLKASLQFIVDKAPEGFDLDEAPLDVLDEIQSRFNDWIESFRSSGNKQ